jgi:hypothetical protein
MSALEAHVRAEIAAWCGQIQEWLSQDTDPQQDAIAKLVDELEKRDAALVARKVREVTSRNRVSQIWMYVTTHIEQGDAAKAYRRWREFELERSWVEGLLNKRDLARGRRTVKAARAGHEAVHGTSEQKRSRWIAIDRDLKRELSRGTKNAAAVALIAKRHDVSTKTVQRVRNYLGKA